jgi:hypothetical protein
MKSRNPNLDWMRKVLADLEGSRSDPRIADLMADLTQPSPNIAADLEPETATLEGFQGDGTSVQPLRRKR